MKKKFKIFQSPQNFYLKESLDICVLRQDLIAIVAIDLFNDS